MIAVKLHGGLGNQMFQYATAKALSLFRNTSLYIDTSFLNNSADSFALTYRSFELGIFGLNRVITGNPFKNFMLLPSNPVRRFVIRVVRKFYKFEYFLEKDLNFDPMFFKCGKNTYIEGYFQSHKYFENIEPIIRETFVFRKPDAANTQFASEISSLNSVSLHIRRGDFVRNQSAINIHGFLGIPYYEEAIRIMTKNLIDPCFYIFSDDHSWVTQNLQIPYSYKIISHNQGVNSCWDMYLMSCCKHNIIANSTFSWWGAWLNSSPGKKVIYPANWFSDNAKNKQIQTMFPPAWQKK